MFDGNIPNLRVHPDCRDPKHPQERLTPLNDAVALWRPSPEQANATPGVLSAIISNQVQLTWTPTITNGPRIERYAVYRSINGAAAVEIDSQEMVYDFDMSVLTQPAAFIDIDVMEGISYTYTVIAFDSYERGVNTNSVTAVPLEGFSLQTEEGDSLTTEEGDSIVSEEAP